MLEIIGVLTNNPITVIVVVAILWWRVGAVERRVGAKLDNGLLSEITDIKTRFVTFTVSTKESLRQMRELREDCKDIAVRLNRIEAVCAERSKFCPAVEIVHAHHERSEAG